MTQTETKKRVRGKAKPLSDRAHDTAGKLLLDQMQNGVPMWDAQGKPVLDEQGQQRRKPPSAALINAAIRWIGEDQRRRSGPRVPPGGFDISKIAKDAARRAALVRPPEDDDAQEA